MVCRGLFIVFLVFTGSLAGFLDLCDVASSIIDFRVMMMMYQQVRTSMMIDKSEARLLEVLS